MNKNIFRSIALILLCIPSVYIAQAQFPVQQKQLLAKLFHVNGDTLLGPALFLYEHDAVAYKYPDGNFRTFSPSELHGFEIFEKGKKDSNRKFRSVLFGSSNSRFFLEELTSGNHKLLKKTNVIIPNQLRKYTVADPRLISNNFQKPAHKPVINDNIITPESGFDQLIDAVLVSSLGVSPNIKANKPNINKSQVVGKVAVTYYIYTPSQEVIMIFNPKRDLSNIFKIKGSKIRKFVKEHNLEYNDPQDMAQIVKFCNSL